VQYKYHRLRDKDCELTLSWSEKGCLWIKLGVPSSKYGPAATAVVYVDAQQVEATMAGLLEEVTEHAEAE